VYGVAEMTSRQRVYDTGNVFDVPVSPPKKVVSIKLEVDIIEEMDRIWRSLGYASRSEFIREAILYYMQVVTSNQAMAKTSVMGIVQKEGELTETTIEDDIEDI